MSTGNATEWLLSQNKFNPSLKKDLVSTESLLSLNKQERAKTISITGGKGGVGKTSVSIKLAKMLAKSGQRVLLIDCDYNLSNTSVKLGIPLQTNFQKFINGEISFSDCLYKRGNFHLLSGCNGNLEVFDHPFDLSRVIIEILCRYENQYDCILLDCPAGLGREALTLNAYSDQRIVVVTPDKSSITDSYSLIKILNQRYGINENHLLVNKTSNDNQFARIVKTMSDTVNQFLNCHLRILGKIKYWEGKVDTFDKELLGEENDLHRDFCQLIRQISEKAPADKSILGPLLVGKEVSKSQGEGAV